MPIPKSCFGTRIAAKRNIQSATTSAPAGSRLRGSAATAMTATNAITGSAR